jgi:TetR/AcrR family transcriptional regulator
MPAAARRRQIAEITVDIVAEHGVEATTTSRIAEAAGVTQSALYRHFPNRNAILLAALDVLYERIHAVIRWSQEGTVLDRLRGIGRFHSDIVSSERSTFVLPLFEFLAASPEAGLRESLRSHQTEVIKELADLIERGKADGSIRPDVDSEQFSWELHGVYWAEDVTYLMGLRHFITSGRSTTMLEHILERIAAVPSEPSSSL